MYFWSNRYYPGPGNNVVFRSTYKLPDGVTCSQCVLQWRYVAGNNWGNCPNGTGMVGCGPQEEFRGCADVKITEDGVPDTTTTTASTTSTTPKTRTRGTVTSRYSRPTKPTETATSTMASPSTTARNTSEPAGGASPVDFNPGPYVGVIIALSTLLFAIVTICGTILYFYHFHQDVKRFVGHHWRSLSISRVGPSHKQERGSKKAPLKLPASVFAGQEPPSVTVVDAVKPAAPPRVRRTPGDLRLLSLTISEPLDVHINGVSVPRDGSSPSLSASATADEPNVSTA